MKNLEDYQEGKLPRSQTQSKLIPGYSKVIHCSKPKYSSETFNMKNQSSKNISLLLDTFSLFSHKGKKANTTPTKLNHPQIPPSNPTSEFTLSPSSTKSTNNKNSNSNSTNSSTSTFYSSITQSVGQEPIKIVKTFQPVSFEELILIEEKIINIVSSIKNKKPYVINECIEWWNCFVVSCFYTGVMGPIKDPEVKVLIKNACSLLMYSILLTYYSILLKSISAKNYDEKLLDMILYHHRIFLLMCEYLLVNLVNSSSTKEEISIIKKLSKQISLYIKHNPSNANTVSTLIVNELRLYCNCLSELIAKLVKKFSSLNSIANSNSSELFSIFQNLKQKSLNDLNDYFIENFLRKKTKQTSNNNTLNNGSTTFSSIEVSVPYLKTKSMKAFTLVLDLDETLIHFHYDIKKDPQITHGIIQYRPGLFEFLQNVAPYFELIIFTVATRQYADPVINTIESKQKFFTCRLYREHTAIYQNDFVKDLKNLGRDLSKVIIVDDKPFNFCLQKENGIAIRPYWGTENENKNDVALINLIPILFDIMKDKSNDVRLGIKRYKNEIVNKVSSYIYQSKMFN